MKVIKHKFPFKQYYREATRKIGVVLHHTVSGKKVTGDISWWLKTKQRVGTPIIIDRLGLVHRLFSSRYWIHHLGVRSHHFKLFDTPPINKKLNKSFIGVELDNWGGLGKRNGKYYSYTGKIIEEENVIFYPDGFRGYYYFERYTERQIGALKELLIYWGNYYKIPLSYKGSIIFKFNERALKGEMGIWTHCSFRPDKSDVHPQPELIQMLKTLS